MEADILYVMKVGLKKGRGAYLYNHNSVVNHLKQ